MSNNGKDEISKNSEFEKTIQDAFQTPRIPYSVNQLMSQGKLGEVILNAMIQFEKGAAGDLQDLLELRPYPPLLNIYKQEIHKENRRISLNSTVNVSLFHSSINFYHIFGVLNDFLSKFLWRKHFDLSSKSQQPPA